MNRRVIFEIADLLTSNESIVTSVREVLKVHLSNVTYLRISFQFKTRYRMIYNFYFIKEVFLYCSLQLAQFVKKNIYKKWRTSWHAPEELRQGCHLSAISKQNIFHAMVTTKWMDKTRFSNFQYCCPVSASRGSLEMKKEILKSPE